MRAAMSEGADAGGQRLRRHAFDRLFLGRVNIHQMDRIGLVKGARKLVHQRVCPRIAVGLEQHVNPLVLARPRSLRKLSAFWLTAGESGPHEMANTRGMPLSQDVRTS